MQPLLEKEAKTYLVFLLSSGLFNSIYCPCSKREKLQFAILFILSTATAIIMQTNLLESPFLLIYFVVKLN